MGMINKLAWPVSPLFIAFVVGNSDHIAIADLAKPFAVIIGLFVLLGVISFFAPLPEVKAVGEGNKEEDAESQKVAAYANSKHSIFQFPHLVLGSLAIFFYVGVETIVLGTLIDYANELGLSHPENYSWIGPISISVGYLSGIIFYSKVSLTNPCVANLFIGCFGRNSPRCFLARNIEHLLHRYHGFRLLIDVASFLAISVDGFRKVYQRGFFFAYHGPYRWCGDYSFVWFTQRYCRHSIGVWHLLGKFRLHCVLCLKVTNCVKFLAVLMN